MSPSIRSRRPSIRALGTLAALTVLLCAGVFAYHHVRGARADKPRYRTQAVVRTDIQSTVTASGTLSPLKSVQVGSQVSGRVLELSADFNSVVKKGDVIARIDPRLFQSDVARARANLTSAYANSAKAQAMLGDAQKHNARTQALARERLVAAADADTALASEKAAAAARTAAGADVAQAKAALEQAETNLAMTTIVSPIDGVVIARSVNVGQTVAASLSAPTLFTIAEDMKAMEVHTSVAESDVGGLREGMEADFNVDAFPQIRFKGTVSQIRYAPTTVQNVVTYDAVVRVDNSDLRLRPGMTANVTFLVEDRRGVLAVPGAALRFTPPSSDDERAPRSGGAPAAGGAGWQGRQGRQGGRPAGRERGSAVRRAVWVLEGAMPRRFEVELGANDGRFYEIKEGALAEGAQVIVGTTDTPSAPAGQPPAGGGPLGGPPAGGAGGRGRRGLGM